MTAWTRPLTFLVLLILVAVLVALPACASLEQPLSAVPVPKGAIGRLMRSVVDVHVTELQSNGVAIRALGTGVVYDRQGLIVTNDHVIEAYDRGVSGQIEVLTSDGRLAIASLVARVPGEDLAFLDIDLAHLTPAEFAADLDAVKVGAQIVAVGAPQHFKKPVVHGRITSILDGRVVSGRPGLDGVVLSNADLRHGFSGGPLADAGGRVLGINMAVGTGEPSDEPVSLAIPAPAVVEAADRLLAAAR